MSMSKLDDIAKRIRLLNKELDEAKEKLEISRDAIERFEKSEEYRGYFDRHSQYSKIVHQLSIELAMAGRELLTAAKEGE